MRSVFLALLVAMIALSLMACEEEEEEAAAPTVTPTATVTATPEATPSPGITPTSEATPTPVAFETARPAVTPTPEGIAMPYEIVEREDVSFGRVVRLVFRIGVGGKATEAELRRIAEEVIEREKKAQPVNAISFFFYLPDTNTRGLYTAGKADWAPDGKWENADQVQAGDYSRQRLVVQAGGALPAVTPSGPGAELAESTRREIFYDLVGAQDSGIGDEKAYEVIAEKYDVSVDVVRQIAVEGATKGWPMPSPPTGP